MKYHKVVLFTGTYHRERLDPRYGTPHCREHSPKGYVCTRHKGHRGAHIAHGEYGMVVYEIWKVLPEPEWVVVTAEG